MPRGGYRPGAGRPKGSRTRPKGERAPKTPAAPPKTAETKAPPPPSPAPTSFKTSIEFAMAAINGEVEGVEMSDRVRLAVALMPFQAPKLGEKKDGGTKDPKPPSTKFAPKAPPGPRLAVSND